MNNKNNNQKNNKKNIIFTCLILFLISVIIIFIANKKNKIYFIRDNQKKSSETLILPSTKIIYKYHYIKDNCNEVISESIPYFLIGMNKNQTKKIFHDWILESFSTNEIIIKKNINSTSNQHYIISTKDGYVAVFYQNSINKKKLKEITKTPVNSLNETEKKRLQTGIKITGDDNLIKILQDYES